MGQVAGTGSVVFVDHFPPYPHPSPTHALHVDAVRASPTHEENEVYRMASLQDRLTSDMKDAMRARASERLGVIRFLLNGIKNAQIDALRPLDDEEETNVLRKQAKMRRDSIDQFRKAGRDDLVAKEESELRILEDYLPAAVSEDRMREAVRAVIAETGASGPKEMGAVIGAARTRLSGEIDGRALSTIAREELAARATGATGATGG